MDELTMIKLVDVSKNYNTDSGDCAVLKNINLEVKQGSSVALFGVSGSGKTTLLNVLGALDKVSSGSIQVCSEDLTLLTNKAQTIFRAKNIGFIFQFFNLIPTLTVLENVMSSLEPIIRNSKEICSRAKECLISLGLEKHFDKFPQTLSGGEQQRVAIARAIVKKPSLILADEPTGNLDSENAEKVMGLIKELQKSLNTTLVIATHDPTIKQYVDRTILIKNHAISEIG